ncbi:LEA type 2 family protein [Uliginosibacterium sp. 31-16]|uniref:LEA type 2 family protein n=1 Tax=Uliginosibacterium sp. 31-16 TaxID=3068315 RepID=UPI00273D59C7|nr:LEA type 2 family protein [Uliginosibacterium sp. 31-16]MDP5240116.1 LEA type 2 family protein [Uliginosibacterium sp. 31-16]
MKTRLMTQHTGWAEFSKRVLVLGAALLLAACATAWQKPQVSLAEVRLAGGNLLQQKLKLQLRVKNPNGVDIGVESLTFDLLVGESRFASGQSAAPVLIPKRGEALVEVDAKAQVLGLLSRLPELTGADGKLHYRLKGEARISGYGNAPFDQPGELELGKLQGLGGARPPAEKSPDNTRL